MLCRLFHIISYCKEGEKSFYYHEVKLGGHPFPREKKNICPILYRMFCSCSYIKLEKHFQYSLQFIAAKQHLTRKACLSVPPHPSSLTPHKISYIINHCHFAAYITTLGLCD